MTTPLLETRLEGLGERRRGKVRDVYDLSAAGLGDVLLLVASDRISAYDNILAPGIPGKGKILTQLSNFWFEELETIVPNHLVATEPEDFPAATKSYADLLRGRSVLVRKTDVVAFECVARGYLAGSGYRGYRDDRKICGIELPKGLRRADRLPEPIFTPATKAESGHDENVSFETMADGVGRETAERLRDLTLELYEYGRRRAEEAGLLLADTKFEFGKTPDGELILIDEVLTPDSSRYWDADAWTPGEEPASFDKQYVRNWLDASGWDHESEPPELPPQVVRGTLDRYVECFRRITGRDPRL